MSASQGFPRGPFEFFTELKADNSKAFWLGADPLKTWLDTHVSAPTE